MAKIRGLFSIHDLMPETMSGVRKLMAAMEGFERETIYLLVVPGCDWSTADLDQIRQWQRDGCQIVGHGWHHRSGPIRTWSHRLHSLLISRQVAEHLSRTEQQIATLIANCHAWLQEQGLGSSNWYVPPAWAMGGISRQTLKTLPFRFFEYQTGVYDTQTDRFWRLPLQGFEADTWTRAIFLRGFNACNFQLAGWSRRPLRVSLHPFDLDYFLGASLRRQLTQAACGHSLQPLGVSEDLASWDV